MEKDSAYRYKPGLAAVIISIGAMMFWAFWGIIENFHEGWYSESLIENISLMFIQYLSPLFIIMTLSLVAIWREVIGGSIFIVAAIVIWLFTRNTELSVPIGIIGILFIIGRVRSKKPAFIAAIVLPMVVLIGFAVEPAIRVSERIGGLVTDSVYINQNSINIVWASRGPGFPEKGTSWDEARRICAHLSHDGKQVMSHEQNIWRLPTAEEAVRSMLRHGKNCGGGLDEIGLPVYKTAPDKEFPLWDTHSAVIYYWTSFEADSANALMIVYSGELWKRPKRSKQENLGFRAVKSR